MRKLLSALALLLYLPLAAQQINPATNITWPRVTGAGTPTALSITCTPTNYGQPYQNTAVTPNTNYSCTTTGWQLINGTGSGSGITALAGDVTATGPGSATATLATVSSSSGVCGDATHVCQVTTNVKGLTTAQTQVAITAGGAVSSVSNSDGTLTITPTTGAVVGSLNLGHANTWNAPQTFAGTGPPISITSSKPTSPSAGTGQIGTDSSGNLVSSDNGASQARVCNATNGVCGGGTNAASTTCPLSNGDNICVTLSPYNAYSLQPVLTTTTGTFGAGTSGPVASCAGISPGNTIIIAGGGSGATTYNGVAVSCSGTTLTVTPATSTSVASGNAVQARPNTTLSASCSATSTSCQVTSCATFVAGLGIYIPGAGTSGANFVNSVSSCTGTTLTFSSATGTTVGSGTVVWHDETAAFLAAINAFASIPGTVYLPAGIYQVNGPLLDTGGANAILKLPTAPFEGLPVAIAFQGSAPVAVNSPSPSVIETLATSAGNIFGGYSTTSLVNHFTNYWLELDNLTLRAPPTTGMVMVGASNILRLNASHVECDTGYFTPPVATGTGACLVYPGSGNQPGNTGYDVTSVGFANGIQPTEHTDMSQVTVTDGTNCLLLDSGINGSVATTYANDITVSQAWLANCTNGIAAGPNGAAVDLQGINFESNITRDVQDTSNVIYGKMTYKVAFTNPPEDVFAAVINGGANLDAINLVSPFNVNGPATHPTGSCPINGAWNFSADGTAYLCFLGTWTAELGGGGGFPITGTGVSITNPSSGQVTINSPGLKQTSSSASAVSAIFTTCTSPGCYQSLLIGAAPNALSLDYIPSTFGSTTFPILNNSAFIHTASGATSGIVVDATATGSTIQLATQDVLRATLSSTNLNLISTMKFGFSGNAQLSSPAADEFGQFNPTLATGAQEIFCVGIQSSSGQCLALDHLNYSTFPYDSVQPFGATIPLELRGSQVILDGGPVFIGAYAGADTSYPTSPGFLTINSGTTNVAISATSSATANTAMELSNTASGGKDWFHLAVATAGASAFAPAGSYAFLDSTDSVIPFAILPTGINALNVTDTALTSGKYPLAGTGGLLGDGNLSDDSTKVSSAIPLLVNNQIGLGSLFLATNQLLTMNYSGGVSTIQSNGPSGSTLGTFIFNGYSPTGPTNDSYLTLNPSNAIFNHPPQAPSFVSGSSSAALAALPSGATGLAGAETATSGVPAGGMDYIRFKLGTGPVTSINGTAESPLCTQATGCSIGSVFTAAATPGTGVTSVTCATATCTNLRGSYTVVGGTATTGTIFSLAWTATPSAYVCTATMNGGVGFLGIGNSVATTTGMNVTAGVTVLGVTFNVNYSCQP